MNAGRRADVRVPQLAAVRTERRPVHRYDNDHAVVVRARLGASTSRPSLPTCRPSSPRCRHQLRHRFDGLDLPNQFPTTKPTALAFVYQSGPNAPMVGKLMFVTNTTFLGADIILYNQDGIIAAPDPVNVGPSNNRWLLSWTVPVAGQISAGRGRDRRLQRGAAVRTGPHPARLDVPAAGQYDRQPQLRSGDDALEVERRPVQPGAGDRQRPLRPHGRHRDWSPTPCRRASARTADEGWTIHLTARGDGELKIGLLSPGPLPTTPTVVDWGPTEERWNLSTSWVTIRTLRELYDVSYAALRLETTGTYIDIDRVCVEPGWLPANLNDWPYFDGDSLYGALDDYSWYGNKDRTAGTPTRAHTDVLLLVQPPSCRHRAPVPVVRPRRHRAGIGVHRRGGRRSGHGVLLGACGYAGLSPPRRALPQRPAGCGA